VGYDEERRGVMNELLCASVFLGLGTLIGALGVVLIRALNRREEEKRRSMSEDWIKHMKPKLKEWKGGYYVYHPGNSWGLGALNIKPYQKEMLDAVIVDDMPNPRAVLRDGKWVVPESQVVMPKMDAEDLARENIERLKESRPQNTMVKGSVIKSPDGRRFKIVNIEAGLKDLVVTLRGQVDGLTHRIGIYELRNGWGAD